MSDAGAVFKNCSTPMRANYLGSPALFVDAEWRRGYRTAEITVAISLVDNKLMRIERRFSSNTPFATERTFEIWETDRAKIQKPNAKPDLRW